ncbi:MAG: DUF927 domain-containing protein [Chloroflexi bacterium]|nr:DUF927 domain-containing protein [Chloroflexota bacterium]
MRVAWRRDGSWKSTVVPRDQIADSKRLIQLAELGFPIISESAKHMTRYLAAFEDINIDVLPKATVSSKFGWLPDMKRFLWGRSMITSTTTVTAYFCCYVTLIIK